MRRRAFLGVAAMAWIPCVAGCVSNPGPCPVSLVVKQELVAPHPRVSLASTLVLRNRSTRPVWLAHVEPFGRSLPRDGRVALENQMDRRERVPIEATVIPGEEDGQVPSEALAVRIQARTAVVAYRIPERSRITLPEYVLDLPYALDQIEFVRAPAVTVNGVSIEDLVGFSDASGLQRAGDHPVPGGSRLAVELDGRWGVPVRLS